MIHDFEEIIFFKGWLTKNKRSLSERFPRLSKRLLSRFENLSVQAFSLAVAEEFILLSMVTILSVVFEHYLLWLGVFMGFFIHLIAHVVQWIVFRRYIPAIYTTFAALAYCILSFRFILSNDLFDLKEIVIWTFVGFGIVVINLLFAHKLAEWFDKRNEL
jgi:hypothetical protein